MAQTKKAEAKINYVEGDLFEGIKKSKCKGTIFIPHVCNDKGAWGAGFVLPLAKYFPQARESYLKCGPVLGLVDYVTIVDKTKNHIDYIICNMVAQTLGGERPLFYNHLVKCMEKVRQCLDIGDEIHAPQFGAGLAGGNWHFIEKLIEDCWLRIQNPPKVTIYKFSPQSIKNDGPIDTPYKRTKLRSFPC